MSNDVLKGLRKLAPHLKKAKDDNLNEADTLLRIIKTFEDVLGYDGFSEISREAKIKDKYVDLAIKVDGVTKFLVEVKAAGTVLRDRHIAQAELYAAEGNIQWVLLTNGVAWTLYHLTFEQGIEYTKAFSVDLSSDSIELCAEELALLDRKSVGRGALEDFWTRRKAVSPASIATALFTTDVLAVLRREIRRREQILIDPEDLKTAIEKMFSTDALAEIGKIRIRASHKSRAHASAEAAGGDDNDATASQSATLEPDPEPPSKK